MQSGTTQFFLLLPELKEEDLDIVIERIMSKWETTDGHDAVEITYVTETIFYTR